MDKKFQIDRIFVGRTLELQKLQELWDSCLEGGEHKAYAVLNAPGVGKTTLLNHFGNHLMEERKGLMVEIRSSTKNNKINLYLTHTLEAMLKSITDNRDVIDDYISHRFEENGGEDEKINAPESIITTQNGKIKREINRKYVSRFKTKEKAIQNLHDIEERLNVWISFLKKRSPIQLLDQEFLANLPDNFPSIIRDLSKIIPVFLFVDEIQTLQSLSYINDKKEDETFLHLCSAEMADLLASKVLIVVSGTQYRLMKEIGYGIGSPIRDKVKHFVIHPLSRENLKEYSHIISDYFTSYVSQNNLTPQLNTLLPWYKQLIGGYSGGHGRTLEGLTNEFFKYLNREVKIPLEIPSTYSNFLDNFIDLEVIEQFYPNFTTKIKEGIQNLQKFEGFMSVHTWIINHSKFGQNLGKRPKVEGEGIKENIETITNDLVQMGILMINGNRNYYLTSYFHLLAYLHALKEQDEYSSFLNEILTNKYFKLMCGYHSRLGYVFEEILLATIMKLPESKNYATISNKIPFNLEKPYDVIKIPKSSDYSTFVPENNAIYHTPLGAGVDFIIRDDNKIILIQVTTKHTVNLEKIQSMDTIFNALQLNNSLSSYEIIKWVISLSPISDSVLNKIRDEDRSNFLITAGIKLRDIIGKDMYDRVVSTKEGFQKT